MDSNLLLINVLLFILLIVLSSQSDLNNGLYLIIGVLITAAICLSCSILLILIIMIVCVKNYKKCKLNAELRSQ